MLSVTRRMRFSAAHRLFNPDLSDEENDRIFGLCSNPAGHGHNYVLEVTVAGEIEPTTGMIVDLNALRDYLDREVITHLDHKNLNVDVGFLKGHIPTAEVLASRIWDLIEANLPAGKLVEVRVYESENNYAARRAGPA